MVFEAVVKLLHLVGFAAFLGGAFAQQQLLKTSVGLPPPARDERESLASAICTKIEVPGIMAQLVTGVLFLVHEPEYLKQHWLHGKLTAVAALLVLSHLEMFNARKIVALRSAGGKSADAEIDALKKKHATMGAVGTVGVVAVLAFVTVLRLWMS
jgi:uncharacterized membrane protein